MIQNPAGNRSSKMPHGSSNYAVRLISGNEIVVFDMPLAPEVPACIMEPITEDLSKLLIEPVDELSYTSMQHKGDTNNPGERGEKGEKHVATRMKKQPRFTPPRLVAPPTTLVPRRMRVTRKLVTITDAIEQPALPPHPQGYPQGTPLHVETPLAGVLGPGVLGPVITGPVITGPAITGPAITINDAQAQQESERLAPVSLPAPTRFYQVQQALTSPSPSPQLPPRNWERRPWEQPDRDAVILLLIGMMVLGIIGGTVSGYLLLFI